MMTLNRDRRSESQGLLSGLRDADRVGAINLSAVNRPAQNCAGLASEGRVTLH